MKTRHGLLVSAFATAFALVAGECLVRFAAPQNLSGTWRVYSPTGYRLNARNARIRHQYGDRVVCYRFNEHGLRGPSLRDNGRRILVLGDSFTFGWLLNEEDTFVRLLQQYADRDLGPGVFQFVNAAVAGWGTSDGLAYLQDYGAGLAPDVVLSILNSDDIGRRAASLFTLNPDATPELVRNPLAKSPSGLKMWIRQLPPWQWLLGHSHLVQLARAAIFRLHYPEYASRAHPLPRSVKRTRIEEALVRFPSSPADPETLRLAPIRGRALYREMNRWCRDHGVKLLVCTLGWKGARNDPTTAFVEQAAQIFQAEEIPFRNLSPEMTAATTGRLMSVAIPGDLHPDEQANRLMAEFIWAWLKAQLQTLFPEAVTSRAADTDG